MISVKIEATGLKETRKAFEGLKKAFDDAIIEVLREYIQTELLERIRVNTPIATGALRESIVLARVNSQAGTTTFVIEANRPYALRVHEGEFRLGARSREQPPQPEGGVGNRYISRVVEYHADDIVDILGGLPEVVVRKLYPSGEVRTLKPILGRTQRAPGKGSNAPPDRNR